MTRTMLVALLSLSATTAAQAGLSLGDRPIARKEVVATVRQQFAEMDANHDGGVSQEEFERYRAIQNAQPDRGRGLTRITRSWFERGDADGDGRVSPGEAQTRPLELFDMADLNRDGVASLPEQSMAALLMGK